jgi:proline iminopeptidase
VGLVLRAVFLGTDEEIAWAFLDGPQIFRPELFAAFRDRLPEVERAAPMHAYLRRLSDPNPDIHVPAAHAWFVYEQALSEMAPHIAGLPDARLSGARLPPTPFIEAHYILNNFFLAPGEILANAQRLSGIDGRIIQGRYDLLCPPRAAYALATSWREARLEILDRAGHAMTEPGMMEAMRKAISECGS